MPQLHCGKQPRAPGSYIAGTLTDFRGADSDGRLGTRSPVLFPQTALGPARGCRGSAVTVTCRRNSLSLLGASVPEPPTGCPTGRPGLPLAVQSHLRPQATLEGAIAWGSWQGGATRAQFWHWQ